MKQIAFEGLLFSVFGGVKIEIARCSATKSHYAEIKQNTNLNLIPNFVSCCIVTK